MMTRTCGLCKHYILKTYANGSGTTCILCEAEHRAKMVSAIDEQQKIGKRIYCENGNGAQEIDYYRSLPLDKYNEANRPRWEGWHVNT